MKTKNEIREEIRKRKKACPTEERMRLSEMTCRRLMDSEIYKKAQTILVYNALPDEVQTCFLLNDPSKRILLPVVRENELVLKEYTGQECLKEGCYGIAGPGGEDFTEIDSIDLIVVPGVAFDKNKNRLGRGKGYYDRLLASTPAFKAGICYDFQILETIPVEEWDIPMDRVISPSIQYD